MQWLNKARPAGMVILALYMQITMVACQYQPHNKAAITDDVKVIAAEELTAEQQARQRAIDRRDSHQYWARPTADYIEARQQAETVLKSDTSLLEPLLGKLLLIPAGRFVMGCSPGDTWCRENEKPERLVPIKAFYLMETEVTFAMWDACVSAGGCITQPDDQAWGRADRPVINVSYNDITQQFIPWLNKTTGQHFRLPSEAEWEYAARAGSNTKFSWGNELGRNNANCAGCGSPWDENQTAPVKSFSPNEYGLYDMHGNVWEWTEDCWNSNYLEAPANSDPRQDGNCQRRSLRGGSWLGSPISARLTARINYGITEPFFSFGFRLVLDK